MARKRNRYDVKLTRTIEHTAVLEGVEADSMSEAIAMAIEIADGPNSHHWVEGDTIDESSKAVQR